MAAAPFFALVGGHDCVLHSAVYAIVTDLTDDLVERTSYIAYISSVNYVVSLFGPSLASAAMTVNLWLPFYLSIGFLGAALPVVYFLPLGGDGDDSDSGGSLLAKKDDIDDPEAEPLLSNSNTSSASSPPSSSSSSSNPSPPQTLQDRLLHLIHRRPRFLLLLSSFVLTSLASSNTHLLPQYMSARYHRSFASVGPLLSLKAATNIVLLTFVVPVGMRVLLRREGRRGKGRANDDDDDDDTNADAEARRRDESDNGIKQNRNDNNKHNNNKHNPATISLNIHAALLSLAVSVLGALGIAAAPRVAWLVCALLLYALGSALPVFTMALVEAVDRHVGDAIDGQRKKPCRRRSVGEQGAGGGDREGDDEDERESSAIGGGGSSSSSSSSSHQEPERAHVRKDRPPAHHQPTPKQPKPVAGTTGTAARVYTVVMVVKTIGTLVGAPLMTAVWVAGINLNDGGGGSGAALGLPFYVSAVLYLCAMGVVWCLKH